MCSKGSEKGDKESMSWKTEYKGWDENSTGKQRGGKRNKIRAEREGKMVAQEEER